MTDYNELKALVNKAFIKGQLACCSDYYMRFYLDIAYCLCKDNTTADEISRLILNQELEELNNVSI